MKPTPKIEQGIPIPPRGSCLRGKTSHFLSTFTVGDSALLRDYTRRQSLDLYHAAKRLKIKITVRKLNGTGFRVWRTA